VEEPRRDVLVLLGVLDPRRAVTGPRFHGRPVAAEPRPGEAGEERGVLPELLAGPRAAGTVGVALGALQSHPEEHPGGAAGHVLRPVLVRAEVVRGVRAGEQVADQLVVGCVRAEGPAEVVFEPVWAGGRRDGPGRSPRAR